MKNLITILTLSLAVTTAQAEMYELKSASVTYSDGRVLTMKSGEFWAGGTMLIEGNFTEQNLTVCRGSNCIAVHAAGTFTVDGPRSKVTATDGSGTHTMALVSSDPLITHSNSGGTTEVDVWAELDGFSRNAYNQGYTQKSAPAGAVRSIGQALNLLAY